jgi:chromosome segregation protein
MGFDPAQFSDSEAQSAMLEKLTADRDRIGPVNLVAEQELAEIDEERGAAPPRPRSWGRRSTACAARSEASTAKGGSGCSKRSSGSTIISKPVHDLVRRRAGASGAGRKRRSAGGRARDHGPAPGQAAVDLTLLSGGEQALTAIALVFALFLTNPAPICVLDEVDAPLDDANVERFCDLLDRMIRETDTRYLIVTHNAVTMSRMHRLYGVTMIEKGVSRLVSVDLGGAETLLAAE